VVAEGADLLTACEQGYGKRTAFDEYRRTKRGGLGVLNIKTRPRNGRAIAVRDVSDEHDLILMSEHGMVVRIEAQSVRRTGRVTQGVRLIRLRKGDRLISLARVPPTEDGAESEPDGAEPEEE
jgi:DNA gyrase subunit A